LTQRERRTIAWGALLVLPPLIVARGIPAWRQWATEAQVEADSLERRLADAESNVRYGDLLLDTLERRNARYVSLAPALVTGSSATTGGPALAAIVTGLAAAAHLRVNSVQLISDSATVGVFMRVAVRLDATGDIAGVTAFLAALDRGPTLIGIREVSIVPRDPLGPPDRSEELRVSAVTEGLVLRPAAAAK
jgi:hypothetical protein